MLKPILKFETEEQAYVCLKEWQERLFLTDWIVHISLVEQHEFENEGEFVGENSAVWSKRSATIKILKDPPTDRIGKEVHEQTLIHELLHLKFDMGIGYEGNGTYECMVTEVARHQLIEQMAKSLIMAKYNLPFEWFKNF